ncbi:plasmid stabilization protein [Kitasatospora sp. MMS16-BH015]|uniref:right-handed parallel beta-helix repeat-containing protein n=1 Tax=Kitasatospora sp. MMS16-BH015 TaxID=2018025 RepID=UPI000CA3E28F|nr:right-handed parallel beta-helix repeat-containing protein [Kitasatospora sp. MMS16-BH015]AUG81558.1 plasmid stabilization protein [Kitasatospora sp. MMS16-BH015]
MTALLAISGAGGCGMVKTAAPPPPAVIRVPEDVPTIQKAVDRARPDDQVLVAPGVYRESVRISRERVVLRGADRNAVVIDGEFKRGDGVVVTGAGSVVQNLTVRNNLFNGVLFTGVTDPKFQGQGGSSGEYQAMDTTKFPPLNGFRASYVTAYDNGLYGIYAFDARNGLIEHSYASGHADSGIYVGQCDPCDTLVRGNLAEHNAIGAEFTNSSAGLQVIGNRFASNRVGVTMGSDTLEALAPQHGAVFAGNVVTANADARTPEQADGGFGIGIGVGGGVKNQILNNLVTGNPTAGVVITAANGFKPLDNHPTGNTLTGNGVDLAFTADPASGATGNCLAGNAAQSSVPADALSAACPLAAGGKLAPAVAPKGISFHDVPVPGPQAQAPAEFGTSAAVGVPPLVADPAKVAVPVDAGAVPQ